MSRIAALVALVFLPSALLAQTQSHIEAAQELLVLMNTKEATEQAFEQIYPLVNSMSEHYPVSDEYRELMAEEMQANLEFIKRELNWSVLEPRLVEVYVGVYSEEELLGLNEFYRTPLGQKFIEKTPEIMEASSRMTMDLFRELIPKLDAMQEERRENRKHRDTH
jgi:hypothetical protein